MNNKTVYSFFAGMFAMVMLLVACGGGGSSTDSMGGLSHTSAQAVLSAFPGYHTVTAVTTKTASMNLSLIPSANAQTTSTNISLTGNYTGFCTDTPASHFTLTGPTEFLVYGLGRWDSADKCGNNWTSVTDDGSPVIGSGTLNNLVVIAKTLNGKDSSGVIKVYTNPGAKFTGITCALGSTTRCSDAAHSVAISDGDNVYVTMTVQPGDNYQNVRVFLGKQ